MPRKALAECLGAIEMSLPKVILQALRSLEARGLRPNITRLVILSDAQRKAFFVSVSQKSVSYLSPLGTRDSCSPVANVRIRVSEFPHAWNLGLLGGSEDASLEPERIPERIPKRDS